MLVLSLLAIPAAVLRLYCVGASCHKSASVASAVPFCSLPSKVRTLIGNGFRTGRSADILTVTGPPGVEGGTDLAANATDVPWATLATAGTMVPLSFGGTGVSPGPIQGAVGLDDVAATEAAILGLSRPHANVRSGTALPGVADGTHPRLLLEIVITGISSADLGDWPHLNSAMQSGASTAMASTGSMPVDPAAVLTTIGTGGLPYQHGMTGTAIRNDKGGVTAAWAQHSPVSVIATLGDDLDHAFDEKPRIGLVAPQPGDRGAIGGNWYLGSDRDDVDTGEADAANALRQVSHWLDGGYGADDVPDLLVAVLNGDDRTADTAIPRLVSMARKASGGSLAVVMTATGASAAPGSLPAHKVAARVQRSVATSGPLIAAADPQGLFLNQHTVAQEKVSEDAVLKALENMDGPAGKPLMDQVFPALAVSFERYC